MIRILLGGSPCTKWSIAQKNNRETTPSGIGWELFKNYLVAKEKFKPDYFLYENNVSAAKAIKDQIKHDLGVWGGTFLTSQTTARYIEINSSLVSAQNRQRFYVHSCGEVEQPQDRGILLKNIINSGDAFRDKSYALTTMCGRATAEDTFKRHTRTTIAESVRIPAYGKEDKSRPLTAGYNHKSDGASGLLIDCFPDNPNKQVFDFVAVLVCVQEQVYGRKATADGTYDRRYEARTDGKCGTLTGTNRQNAVAIPVTSWRDKKIKELVDKYGYLPEIFNLYNLSEIGDKCPTITAAVACDNTLSDIQIIQRVRDDMATIGMYVVKGGQIYIKNKTYPVKLADGFYIIRKLTVEECRRLQTIPDWYKMPCSNAQNYKMLGNGWTVEVIKHILGHIPEIKHGEPIEVLSMYDGMSCGQIALKELGANIVKYSATEIDKYAIQTTQANFPNTIQLGDAFKVRDDDFTLSGVNQ